MINVINLSKSFKRYPKPSDRLKELFSFITQKKYHKEFKALDDITFDIQKGQALGILGKNGAGKSTLLKILSGVLLPSTGSFIIKGRLTALLELGTGFDGDLTGRQNIKANGLLIGMTLDEINKQTQAIIDFSELEQFIDEPVRTYSSGMTMRLAFSIAMHANPDCLIIDEALSVGDAHFQQKSMKLIKQFRKNGGSLIFVSHDLNAVKMICDQAIVIDQGKVVAKGSAEYAVNHYNRIMAKLDEKDKLAIIGEKQHEKQAGQNFGSQKASILKSWLQGEKSETQIISSGEKTNLLVQLKVNQDLNDLTIGLMVRDRFGQDIFGTNSHHLGTEISLKKGQQYQAKFSINMAIAPGKYTITIALHSKDNHIDDCYHWIDNAIKFEVAGIIGNKFAGICRLDSQCAINALPE